MVNLVAADSSSFDVVGEFPSTVREVPHLWIPMRDGTRLAARMWLPEDAVEKPVPAIVEYLPYRQADFTAPRDALMHPYFAGHGYVALRVDIRGSGNSYGAPMDEYVQQEQDDAIDMLEWIATQPWCSGQTALIGISWGGFAALQIAARKPPSLKAIITVCSTDDRYHDDVHYMGGCLLSTNLAWGTVMYGYSMRPPNPNVVGDDWRSMWLSRMRTAPRAMTTWMQHQTRDAYWRHGSVCENYDDIDCAVYAIGGWTDGYSNAIARLLNKLSCPKRALIGPWAHGYPHIAAPGPTVGFLQDAVRWWDRWLKDQANGIDEEPALTTWIQEPKIPTSSATALPGRWIRARDCSSQHQTSSRWYLGDDELLEDRHTQGIHKIVDSALTTGVYAGEWCPHGLGPELPLDQRLDDATSLLFDTAPLTDSIEVFGAPKVTLRLSSNQPSALVVARLCSVSPSGDVARITYGVLNLTHRDGHQQPQWLQTNTTYEVQLKLNDVALRLPIGYRLRLLLSTSCWPLLWPSPRKATLTVACGDSYIDIPRRTISPDDAPVFAKACVPKSPDITWLRPVSRERLVENNIELDKTTLIWRKDDGAYRLNESGIEVDATGLERHSIVGNDPLSAESTSEWTFSHRCNSWAVRVNVRNTIRSTLDRFLITTTVNAWQADELVYENMFNDDIPRGFL